MPDNWEDNTYRDLPVDTDLFALIKTSIKNGEFACLGKSIQKSYNEQCGCVDGRNLSPERIHEIMHTPMNF